MVNEKMGIDLEKLAQSIASDISKLDKVTATRINLKHLERVDFSVLSRGATAETVKHVSERVRRRAEEAVKKNRTRVEEVSGKLENTLRKRRTKLASGLKELNKTDLKKDVEAKIILNRVSDNADLSARRLNELRMEKAIKTDVRLPRRESPRLDIDDDKSPG